MEHLLVPIITTILSVIIGVAGYMMRNIFTRLNDLEKFPAVTEAEVRQIISDKVDPIKEDVSEIRKTVDYIFSLILTKK